MRLGALLIVVLVVIVTACGSDRSSEARVTVTVTKTAPPPVTAKPTRADRVAITKVVRGEACQEIKTCEISGIRFAKSDASYAGADIYDPKVGGAFALLRHKSGDWKVIDLGSASIGCTVAPIAIQRDLKLDCPGVDSGQQASPPPPPVAKPAEPADPYNGRPGDKHFAVYYLQLKDDGLGDIGGIARVKNVSSKSLSGLFTFTFFQGEAIVGTAQGSAQEVSPGQTVTVQLISQDKVFAGRFRYQFQVDTEF